MKRLTTALTAALMIIAGTTLAPPAQASGAHAATAN
jgi:hypothetical protein